MLSVRTKVSKKFNAEEKLPVTKHLLVSNYFVTSFGNIIALILMR